MQTARFKKSSLRIIICLKVSSTIYLFINLFICFYLLAIFAVRSSGTAEAIHTARLLQLVPLIRGAWLVIKEQQTFKVYKFIIHWIKTMKRISSKVHAQSFNNKQT